MLNIGCPDFQSRVWQKMQEPLDTSRIDLDSIKCIHLPEDITGETDSFIKTFEHPQHVHEMK